MILFRSIRCTQRLIDQSRSFYATAPQAHWNLEESSFPHSVWLFPVTQTHSKIYRATHSDIGLLLHLAENDRGNVVFPEVRRSQRPDRSPPHHTSNAAWPHSAITLQISSIRKYIDKSQLHELEREGDYQWTVIQL